MDKMTLKVRCVEDLLAAVPVLLGFEPTDSLVVMGVRGCGMHARLDHPRSGGDFEGGARLLVEAMGRNGVTGCVLVSYVDDGLAATLAREAFVRACNGAEIVVDRHLWVHAGVWRQPGPGGVFEPVEGVAFDVSAHPMLAEAVVAGVTVPLGSRDALVASLVGVPDPVEALVEARDALAAVLAGGVAGVAGLTGEGRWVQQRVREFTATGVRLDVGDAARMLAAVERVELRDVVWAEINRATSVTMVDLLADLVRRAPSAPSTGVAEVAGLLAFAAWQAGRGALAWCAVDRAIAADPRQRLARLVSDVLEAAMPPDQWPGMDPETVPVFTEEAAAAAVVVVVVRA